MASVTPARRKAAALLRAVSRGRRLDVAFSHAVDSLSNQDRRWLQEAVYGTLRLRGRLDHLLDLHLSRGLESVPGPALDLLRLGAYQLLYMDAVPPYAAISQTVDQVRDVMGKGGGRLANAVLRSLEREGGDEARFPDFQADPLGYLASWGSHPPWLVKRWLARWGPEQTRALVEENNTTPPLFLRPLGMAPREAAHRLGVQRQDEISLEGGISQEEGIPCIRLPHGTNPAALLEGFSGIIQDPGAALVTVFADPPAGVRVADLCAAPGGKALSLAGDGQRVLAGDRSSARMAILRENAGRVGVSLDFMVADARHPPLARADFVLLDVPCSGTGTFRRHPDARWRLTEGTLDSLVGLQREILDAAGTLVPPGGTLVYSTCTLEEEENQGQVRAFLERHPRFRPEETGSVLPRFIAGEGFLQVLPQDSGYDGSFAARLVRQT